MIGKHHSFSWSLKLEVIEPAVSFNPHCKRNVRGRLPTPLHLFILEFLLLCIQAVYPRGLARQTLSPLLNSDPRIRQDRTPCLNAGPLLAAWLLACILRWPENKRHWARGPWRDDILPLLLPDRPDLFNVTSPLLRCHSCLHPPDCWWLFALTLIVPTDLKFVQS